MLGLPAWAGYETRCKLALALQHQLERVQEMRLRLFEGFAQIAAGISSTKQVYPPSWAGSKTAATFMSSDYHATACSSLSKQCHLGRLTSFGLPGREDMTQELASRVGECLPRGLHSRKLSFMDEIIFEVTQEGDGGFAAECMTEGIFTQADNWDGLRRNVKEAVSAFYFDQPKRPTRIRLHLVRDEVLA